MLVRIGSQIDWRVSDRVYDLVVRLPLRTRAARRTAAGARPRHHSLVVSGAGPAAYSTCHGCRSTWRSALHFTR